MHNISDLEAEDSRGAWAVPSALMDRVAFYDYIVEEQPRLPTAERLSYINSELKDIHTYLAHLHRQRNSLVVALRLPPEIFSHIISYLAKLEPHYPELDGLSSTLKAGLGWIKITQVCYDWRQMALADNRLWTTATTSLGDDWFKKMLELSLNLPEMLDVRSDLFEKIGESQLEFAERYMDKLETLQIMGKECSLRTLAKSSAPVLRSFKVHSLEQSGTIGPSWLFGGKHDSLRDLHVQNVCIDWSDPFFRNLTHINLTLGKVKYYFDESDFLHFLEALRALPDLESLTMKKHFFSVSTIQVMGAASTIAPISCPRLANVDVYSSPQCILTLLGRLQPSSSAQLNLASDSAHELQSPILEFVQEMLRQHFAQSDTTLISGMQTIEWRSWAPAEWRRRVAGVGTPAGPGDPVFEKAFVLSGWREDEQSYLLRDYAGFGTTPTPHFRLTIEHSEYRIVYPEELIPMTAFPAARNVSLKPLCRLPFHVYNHGWMELFATSRSLVTLRADQMVVDDLLAAHHMHTVSRDPLFPPGVTELALLNNDGWAGGMPRTGRPLDQWLAELWTVSRAQGVALSSVLAGSAPVQGDGFDQCVRDAGITLFVVERPHWFKEGHDEWDEHTADW